MALEHKECSIEVEAKSLKAGLVQYVVKRYIHENLFELIKPEKIQADIYREISDNLKFENLNVEVKYLSESDLIIDIIIDQTAVNIYINPHPFEMK